MYVCLYVNRGVGCGKVGDSMHGGLLIVLDLLYDENSGF